MTFKFNRQYNRRYSIVKLINKYNNDINPTDIDKSPKYNYEFNIQKTNNQNNNIIFKIKINPNAYNTPYFQTRIIKDEQDSTTQYGIGPYKSKQ